MPSTYITRTPSSTGNQKTFTLSFWWKTTPDGQDKCLFSSGLNSSNYFMVRTTGAETLQILTKDNGTTGINYQSSQSFRDANAWYHIVLTIDTTQSSGDRVKYYVNGERVTSFLATTEPSASANILYVNDTTAHAWGRKNVTSDKYLNGSLSHVHFIDGTAYDASAFGSTDSTTGEWKINTSPSVTYGTNGYFILKDGNSVTDQSGNSNNFTVTGGTLTKTEDCPSNVFCTANPLSKMSGVALTNGNTTVRKDTSGNSHSLGTIAFGNGKYYFEGYRHGGGYDGIGICLASADGTTDNSVASSRVLYYEDGQIMCDALSNQSNISTGVSYADTDIISVSFDTENGVLKFYKNDTLVSNSTITNSSFEFANNLWVPHTYQSNGGEWRLNFGNGYFGTTAVSSAGTNASGNGIFEYDVPTGFTALSTKGLNE